MKPHALRQIGWLSLIVIIFSGSVQAESFSTDDSQAFDATTFGRLSLEEGKSITVRWAEFRKIRQVIVEFEPNQNVNPAELHVQYWHRNWDGRPDKLMADRNAGEAGWDAMDDWTNGSWKDADTHQQIDGNQIAFSFVPANENEFPDPKTQGVTYRKTLKVRIIADNLPKIRAFHAFTDSRLQNLTVRMQLGSPASPAIKLDGDETCQLELFNGRVVALRSTGSCTIDPTGKSWRLPNGRSGTVEADLLVAVDPMGGSYDRTIVTVRSDQRPFSFAADEVARGDRILVDDLGVLVTQVDDPIGLDDYRKALKNEFTSRGIYDRVKNEAEQTLERAWNDMPLKHPLHFVHGLPGDRNVMQQKPNGEICIAASARWFNVQPSPRDSKRKLWESEILVLDFGLPADSLRGGRELAEGYLPQLRTWWQDGPIFYELNTVMDTLDGKLDDIRLDTPTALLMRLRVVNTSDSQVGTAALRFRSHDPKDRDLRIKPGTGRWAEAVVQTPEGQRLRFLADLKGKGQLAADGNTTTWSLPLTPNQSHTIYFLVPSITLTEPGEIDALNDREFEIAARRIREFWTLLCNRETRIHTGEAWLDHFYKAHLQHLMINCLKELDSDVLHSHVGTFSYGDYSNESAMMISDLDRRGYAREAELCLNNFLKYQGTVPLPGNYTTADGVLYGSGGHETGGYNKDHGCLMWNLGEHWWNTRDRRWMAENSGKMIKACNWVTTQRKTTMIESEPGKRPIEYGWLPAGSLEDVTDYWYWLSTNAATVWGFLNLADALADFGHPDGTQLQADAAAYRDDFLRGVTESRIRCPVVRLRDGTYVPKVPSRLYERGRSHGWVRETLEGSMCLPAYRLISPQAPETSWIIKDYEDNLYISRDYGYSIPVFSFFWFSRGGFSIQANLLDGPLPYLWRDEIKHYLRAFFNGFTSAFYPETMMCNEHSLPELGYPFGDHFKTSDEAQVTYWLRLMYISEQGADLHLGRAIPRYWLADGKSVSIKNAPSYFGPLSWQADSNATAGKITVRLDPPSRNRPKHIYVRIRHPESKPIKSVLLNNHPYEKIDVAKEWIILPGDIQGEQEIVAQY